MKEKETSRIFSESVFTVRIAGDGLLTAEMLGESLEGWGGIYRRVPAVLAQHHPAFRHVSMVLFVEHVEHGSMVARVIARLVTSSAEDAKKMESDIDSLTDLSKQVFIENIQRMNTPGRLIVTAAVGGVLTYGAMRVGGFLDEKSQNVISGNNQTIINQGALYFSTTPDNFQSIIARATTDKSRLVKQTLAAVRPAGSLTDGAITIGDEDGALVIDASSAKILSAVQYESLQPRIEKRSLTNAAISIRALDLDHKASGWAAIIPDISTQRVGLSLGDGVNIKTPGTYIGVVDVDISVDMNGKETPKRAHLRSIHAP